MRNTKSHTQQELGASDAVNNSGLELKRFEFMRISRQHFTERQQFGKSEMLRAYLHNENAIKSERKKFNLKDGLIGIFRRISNRTSRTPT
ncbi:hypothetical protein BA894_07950 [Vibrio natriegens]|nr:hypothetical protein BA894_07950 [Vibrio natriegens]